MVRRHNNATELLEIAGRLRTFAREAGDRYYFDKFQRGAEDLEFEAVGYAASSTIAHALRRERRISSRKSNPKWIEGMCRC